MNLILNNFKKTFRKQIMNFGFIFANFLFAYHKYSNPILLFYAKISRETRLSVENNKNQLDAIEGRFSFKIKNLFL